MRLDPSTLARVVAAVRLGNIRAETIAEQEYIGLRTVYKIQANIRRYNTPYPPRLRGMGRPRSITTGAGELLLQFLDHYPWAYLEEQVQFLWDECGIDCSASTVSRFLEKMRITKKIGQRVNKNQNLDLRHAWLADMVDLPAELLVFIDETLFNESTGWRKKAWAGIGHPARYHHNNLRGKSWSVLPAYTVDGYLPCTGVKEGYYDGEAFLNWLENNLLPLCGEGKIIIMDNNSTHQNPEIKAVIEARGCSVRYLPPYSPDFNPIELTFSVLKAWVRKHYYRLWPTFGRDFGAFLKWGIEQSECDRFAEEHFRHCGGGYMFDGDYEAFQRQLNLLDPVDMDE